MKDDDSDGVDPVVDRSAVNLNIVPQIIGEDVISFERVTIENVSQIF